MKTLSIYIGRGGLMFDEDEFHKHGIGWSIDPEDNCHLICDGQSMEITQLFPSVGSDSSPCFTELKHAEGNLLSKLSPRWRAAEIVYDAVALKEVSEFAEGLQSQASK